MELLIFLLGVITAIVGYLISNFVFDPVRKFKDYIAVIGSTLTYYSHIITSPGSCKLADEASPVIRALATNLERVYLSVPLLSAFVNIGVLPTKQKIVEAKGQLILIHNTLGEKGKTDINSQAMQKIFTLLNIKELEQRYNLNEK